MGGAEFREDGVAITFAANRGEWRKWLAANGTELTSVWLVLFNKNSGRESVSYEEAVEEALCFGWIDSKPNKRDSSSRFQFFARRKPKSNWSLINRERAERMIKTGRMTPLGQEMIDLAKRTGTWTALDSVEKLELPDDLKFELESVPGAFENFTAFPRSVKKGILEWILNAKLADTRKKRIEETAQLAGQNIRANQYRPKIGEIRTD
jgi:uncharacterized protein YdeI (YjbR/CyaY-like superfamily)